MRLTGLHLLLTYQCNYECDHCFVWGGPRQDGTMTLESIRRILDQADKLEDLRWIYFEGGEPFLYYPLLVAATRAAVDRGFQVGIVTNGYWATEVDDAVEWLRPFRGMVHDLSISRDTYHGNEESRRRAGNARRAAKSSGIPEAIIRVAEPEDPRPGPDEYAVRFRGRAAVKLAPRAEPQPWTRFTECPWENLSSPERVHVDPLGHVHLCQGISIGNLFERPLQEICGNYEPQSHPVVAALLDGGPAELSRRHGLARRKAYADACHLCFEARFALRSKYPEHLTPDAMYGG